MKELARECILASRAESAEDLVNASLVAHQAASDREQPVNKKEKTVGHQEVPVLKGRDGRPIFPVRPTSL